MQSTLEKSYMYVHRFFFGWNGQAPIRDFATPELLPPSIATAEEVEEKAKHFLRQLGGRWGKIGEMSSGENGELFVGRGMSTIVKRFFSTSKLQIVDSWI